jgi:CCR4-NOT transcriptional complex subunit CAF120
LHLIAPAHFPLLDQFVTVLGSVTVPGTANTSPRRYNNVLTLNTAGSNLMLFSCPTTPALISWAAALRLSAWEKSRLEEIYTAHLIRITLNDGEVHSNPYKVHSNVNSLFREIYEVSAGARSDGRLG